MRVASGQRSVLVGGFRYVVSDVFTDMPLSGNQLAVFTDARDPRVAAAGAGKGDEFSETVFVSAGRRRRRRIRIFTPATELPFAGHPILGAAFVLGGPLQSSRSGSRPARASCPWTEREGPGIDFGWMDQPTPSLEPYQERNASSPSSARGAGYRSSSTTGAMARHGRARLVGGVARCARFGALAGLLSTGGLYARDRSGGSRALVPGAGVDDDPATGSGAGPLALHLARHGRIAFGEEIEISQGAEIRRSSTLYAVAHSPERIEVGGSAVIVARGEFQV